jgi:hypothetical protein
MTAKPKLDNARFVSADVCEAVTDAIAARHGGREAYAAQCRAALGYTVCATCDEPFDEDTSDADAPARFCSSACEADAPNDCPECSRSYGPHYAGPCEHV